MSIGSVEKLYSFKPLTNSDQNSCWNESPNPLSDCLHLLVDSPQSSWMFGRCIVSKRHRGGERTRASSPDLHHGGRPGLRRRWLPRLRRPHSCVGPSGSRGRQTGKLLRAAHLLALSKSTHDGTVSRFLLFTSLFWCNSSTPINVGINLIVSTVLVFLCEVSFFLFMFI